MHCAPSLGSDLVEPSWALPCDTLLKIGFSGNRCQVMLLLVTGLLCPRVDPWFPSRNLFYSLHLSLLVRIVACN